MADPGFPRRGYQRQGEVPTYYLTNSSRKLCFGPFMVRPQAVNST